MDPVNVILCGAGRMGRNHLRVVRQDPAFALRAIVDPALAGGAIDGVPVLSEIPRGIDAAIVATPTDSHQSVVIELLERGIDVLVEKPLASTVAGCEAIARCGGRVAVGHVERFNPAVRGLPDLGRIERLTFARLGSRPCDVLLELAVHDLDLLERLAGRASLRSARVQFFDDVPDVADLELVTETGAAASIVVAARRERARHVTIECARGTVELDLLAPAATLNGIPIVLRNEEPLRAQLRAFHAFLRGDDSDVGRIDQATRSVALAEAARRAPSVRLAEAAP